MDTHITMKEMPESEKPVEKCFRYGAQALSDAELLAVILKSGTKGMTALQLAQFFLSKKDKNLLNLTACGWKRCRRSLGLGR